MCTDCPVKIVDFVTKIRGKNKKGFVKSKPINCPVKNREKILISIFIKTFFLFFTSN